MDIVTQTINAVNEKDYAFAIYSQTACNLGALVHGFERVVIKLQAQAHAEGHGTDWINEHPICRLYAEQIAHLTRKTDWNTAYDECVLKGKVEG